MRSTITSRCRSRSDRRAGVLKLVRIDEGPPRTRAGGPSLLARRSNAQHWHPSFKSARVGLSVSDGDALNHLVRIEAPMNSLPPFLALALAMLAAGARAQDQSDPSEKTVRVHNEAAFPGYTLIAPLNSLRTLLVDMDGRVVHEWKSEYPPGQAVYLLNDGRLLRAARDPADSQLRGGGEGGRVEEFDWEGKLLWSFPFCNDQHRQHHDIEPMPNGNVLVIAWEAKTKEQALAAGRDAEAAEQGIWPDMILEIEPTRPVGGKVVWEWHVWDHIVQDRDPKLPNFGVVAEHPELLDLNVNRPNPNAKAPAMSEEQVAQLQALGYLGATKKKEDGEDGRRRGGRGPGPGGGDWNHVNAVAYNAELDQILLSSHNQNEIWIIDHGTTSKEAAGHSGGKRGRGGDFLYRWGNPANYQRGTSQDRQLSGQHDARWIENGLLGEGHILVFNNNVGEGGFGFGPQRRNSSEPQSFSIVLEVAPPLAKDGTYTLAKNEAWGPAEVAWSYSDHESDPPLFSPVVSGANRLPNDDTLICSGVQNRVLEVTPEGEIVWDFRSPYGGDAPVQPGFGGGPPPGGPGAPGGAGPPPGGGGGGGRPGGRGGFGGPGGFGGIFRATRIAFDHPAVKGKELAPAPEKKAD
jgi:hypothetical protein